MLLLIEELDDKVHNTCTCAHEACIHDRLQDGLCMMIPDFVVKEPKPINKGQRQMQEALCTTCLSQLILRGKYGAG